MARLKDYYKQDIAPALMKKFSYKSVMQIFLEKENVRLLPSHRENLCLNHKTH